jgi:mycoredoxin
MENDSQIANPNEESTIKVVVYGTRWCAATQYVRRFLDRNNVTYSFRDLDRDQEAADQVRWWTGGNLSHPTIQIGGEILVEPLSNEIQFTLQEKGLI